jgi:four helix bundle protein
MASVKRFEDLEVWQLSRQVCSEVYSLTSRGDFSRDYSLKDQIRRAAGSVMDNIAEGFDRGGNKEFKLFLSYSKGSADEVKSQLYRALDNGYINQEAFENLYSQLENIGGKLTNLIKYLSATQYRGTKYK